MNLVSNAIKFTKKGYIKIIAKQIKTFIDNQLVELLQFDVKDTGIGIREVKIN